MKADLVIYTHVFGMPGQYESVALMLSHKMDFNCCANRDGFCKSSHIIIVVEVSMGMQCMCLHDREGTVASVPEQCN